MEDTSIPLTSYETYIKNHHDMEERKEQKLNPPKFGENLQRDWKNDLYMNQISYQRSGMNETSNVERIISIVAIIAILGICYYYWPLLDGLFREGVK